MPHTAALDALSLHRKTGLYLSIALPVMNDRVLEPGLLTTATAVIVRHVIASSLGYQLSFKWVNDLIFNDKKVGGILTEGVLDIESQSLTSLVVGIGLNLIQPTNLPDQLDKSWWHRFGFSFFTKHDDCKVG